MTVGLVQVYVYYRAPEHHAAAIRAGAKQLQNLARSLGYCAEAWLGRRLMDERNLDTSDSTWMEVYQDCPSAHLASLKRILFQSDALNSYSDLIAGERHWECFLDVSDRLGATPR